MNWLNYLFCSPKFFELDDKKHYELNELIEILKNENVTVGTGNSIVLTILDELVKKHEK